MGFCYKIGLRQIISVYCVLKFGFSSVHFILGAKRMVASFFVSLFLCHIEDSLAHIKNI